MPTTRFSKKKLSKKLSKKRLNRKYKKSKRIKKPNRKKRKLKGGAEPTKEDKKEDTEIINQIMTDLTQTDTAPPGVLRLNFSIDFENCFKTKDADGFEFKTNQNAQASILEKIKNKFDNHIDSYKNYPQLNRMFRLYQYTYSVYVEYNIPEISRSRTTKYSFKISIKKKDKSSNSNETELKNKIIINLKCQGGGSMVTPYLILDNYLEPHFEKN